MDKEASKLESKTEHQTVEVESKEEEKLQTLE